MAMTMYDDMTTAQQVQDRAQRETVRELVRTQEQLRHMQEVERRRYAYVRNMPESQVRAEVVVPKPVTLTCKLCRWDYVHDPNKDQDQDPYFITNLKYCEYCAYVVARRPNNELLEAFGITDVGVEIKVPKRELLMREVRTVRTWLANIGMLGLMGLGGFGLALLIGWILDLFGYIGG